MIRETVNYTIVDFRIKTRSAMNYTMSSHHFHDAYEIYYMNSGSRDYFLGDRTYPVRPGELVLIKPHDIHKTIDTGVRHSRVLISFQPDFLPFREINSIIDICFASSRVLHFPTKFREQLEAILREMIVTACKSDDYHLAQLQGQLTNMLILIAKYMKHNVKQQAPNNPPTNEKVYAITQYLKANYNKHITLDSLADQFFLSRYHLTRVFKKNTGFTIFEYLHSIRIVEAQRLLRETTLKIIEISASVGFSNVSNFGKVFKSIAEQSPSSYRKEYRSSDS